MWVGKALGDAAEQAVHARNVIRLRMNMNMIAEGKTHGREQCVCVSNGDSAN
jgi:hypothetical protein